MRLCLIVSRTNLGHELVFVTDVDGLLMLASVQVPEVQLTTVLCAQKNFGNESVFESVRRAPFAGDECIVAEVPPRIIGELLWAAVDLPAPEDVKAFVIHQEDAAGRLAFRVAEGRNINSIRTAIDRVWPRITGLLRDLFRFDHPDDCWSRRVGLGIEDVNAR